MSRIARSLGALAAALAATLAATLVSVPAANAAQGALPGDMAMGDPKAKVTVVEYASVTCPHCGRFNADVFPAFKAKYVDTGKVRYVFREFPTDPVELAAAGFIVARCAPADRYFAVIDTLFKGQQKLFASQDAKTFLMDAGTAGGLSKAQVEACLADKGQLEDFNDRVQAAVETAKIQATPTFVIGATKLEGEQTLAALDAVIQPLLAAR
ncbi:MAG TPA: DsbA family protein [Caulobacteraceae bacterium]|jgi:protein-disulfide isomerase|nr:DsbA family protein [Caulobacteraceae bacterium]